MKMDSIAIFKALGDSSRLNMVRELLKGPLCVEELCERLKLVPSTISHHSARLLKAGLIVAFKEQQTVIYKLEENVFGKTLGELIKTTFETQILDGRKDVYEKRVLQTFIEFGRLKSIPVQRKKRLIVLKQIAQEFEPGKIYLEKEVNEIIENWHEDYCYLRREMIGEGILMRKAGKYRRVDLS